ncbi:serine/threonine-protein kinase [Microbacterium sp. G2-8]|uniref:protein kinase domain-containing protein n=1 Tax=Microbacterium sp. G2-8 TaxID=2842454 RepID=UPI001C8A3EBB|nr:serine/threonine-protein kinase [Microbacterium sp. G2-8]
MSRRTASEPPEIPGFTYLELLGSGGFADVFLYEQKMPRRRVAIKVLLPDRISTSAAQFTAEANVMAMLSTHPAIAAVYQAGVADDGRPYLVMEYCPRPNLQVRYRRERFSVGEALHTGIPVAAAVETAHRANVLHRDIKPANILVTEYNRPALTDFGIASSSADPDESLGVSVPWSPPEAFAEPPRSDPRSDVYQLGATVYTLLAGRSPFEVAGESNTSTALIDRIETMPLPPLGRSDVPRSLVAVLEKAMAKDPDERFRTAAAFARALQKVQIERGDPVTQIDILDDGYEHDEGFEDDEIDELGSTQIRRIPGSTTVLPGDHAGGGSFAPPSPGPADPFEIPAQETQADHSAFAPPSAGGDAGALPAWADELPAVPEPQEVSEEAAAAQSGAPEHGPSDADATVARPSRDDDEAALDGAPDDATRARAPRADSPVREDSPRAEPPADDETAVRPPRTVEPADDETAVRPPRTVEPADDETAIRSSRTAAAADDVTRARPPASSAPADDTTAARPRRAASQAPAAYTFDSRVEFGAGSVPKADPSQFRVVSRIPSGGAVGPAVTKSTPTVVDRRSRRRLVIGIIIAGLAVLGGVAALAVFLVTQTGGAPNDEIPDEDVAAVTDLQGRAEATGEQVTFTWNNPDPSAGDTYEYGVIVEDQLGSFENSTSEATATVDLESGAETCIQVRIVRANGAPSLPESACVSHSD